LPQFHPDDWSNSRRICETHHADDRLTFHWTLFKLWLIFKRFSTNVERIDVHQYVLFSIRNIDSGG
jgi:hypothetical protein